MASNVKLKFVGNLDHFDVFYTGGLVGSGLFPVAKGSEVTIDLVGKVATTGTSNNRYLNFRIVPTTGATVISATASPTPTYNSFIGSRNWMFVKGSLPYLASSATIETASEILYTITVVSSGPAPSVSSPFNKLFSLTREKMDELSNKMLGVWGSNADGSPANGGFLINLMLLPFKTPTAVIGDTQTIKIGAFNTGVTAPIINDDSIDVDLGNIVVGGLAGNVMDYAAATYELFLPFFGDSLTLEPHQVIGKTINARYDLDVYTGEVTANIFNDNSGVPIASANDRVARGIPFKMFSEVQNRLSEAVQTNNGLLQAYIRVTRQDIAGGQFNNLVLVNGVIGSGAGYIEVENADLRGVPNTAQVLNLLQQGVIIR